MISTRTYRIRFLPREVSRFTKAGRGRARGGIDIDSFSLPQRMTNYKLSFAEGELGGINKSVVCRFVAVFLREYFMKVLVLFVSLLVVIPFSAKAENKCDLTVSIYVF